MRHIFGWILICLSAMLFIFADDITPILRRVAYQNAVNRQLQYLCQMYRSNQVSDELLCYQPIPSIEALRYRYAKIKEEDEAWYQLRGSRYYPEVICETSRSEPQTPEVAAKDYRPSRNVYFNFLGQRYACGEARSDGKPPEIVRVLQK